MGISLFSQTFFIQKGWNLLGTSQGINVTNFDVDISWKYEKEWLYFSKKYKIKDFKTFQKIEPHQGFWILNSRDKKVIFSDRKVLIFPLYFYNQKLWNELTKIDNDAIFIVNPLNGAGNSIDVNYKNFLNNSKVNIGYIYTSYGKQSLTNVKNEIDKWLKLYPNIKGFFIDEVSLNNLDYYKKIADYIKEKGNFLTVLNPGTKPDKEMFEIADIVVVYEGKNPKYAEYCNDFPQKSALIMFDVKETQMKNLLNAKCRYLYFDESYTNNYEKVPSYFEEELKGLK